MGIWATLCLLCGVAPSGGPRYLAANCSFEMEEHLVSIVKELRQLDVTGSGSPKGLQGIVEDAFDVTNAYSRILPRGYGMGDYCQTYVGIGYWSSEGTFNGGRPEPLVPDGRRVEVRRLRHAGADCSGDFHVVIEDRENSAPEEVPRSTYCYSPCLFLCEHCYHFLATWLETEDLPHRIHAFPNDPEPLSFAGELYEVVNSHKTWQGVLAEIEYDGIENSFDYGQDFVLPGCWKNARNTAAAIKAGLRGKTLFPAIVRDSRVWMFMRPNIWPHPPKIIRTPQFTRFTPGIIPTILAVLPLELLIPLLAQLTLSSILALSSTCRSFRNFITNPPLLDRVLKEAIARGSLRWILPVSSIPRSENNAAREAFLEWRSKYQETEQEDDPDVGEGDLSVADERDFNDPFFPSDDDYDSDEEDKFQDPEEEPNEEDIGGEDPAELLVSQDFPRLAFIRACWGSDSMMNRKRLWGQVKRFEVLWKEYRTDGWKDKNRFYPSAELDRREESHELP